jgi:hypothetical protein
MRGLHCDNSMHPFTPPLYPLPPLLKQCLVGFICRLENGYVAYSRLLHPSVSFPLLCKFWVEVRLGLESVSWPHWKHTGLDLGSSGEALSSSVQMRMATTGKEESSAVWGAIAVAHLLQASGYTRSWTVTWVKYNCNLPSSLQQAGVQARVPQSWPVAPGQALQSHLSLLGLEALLYFLLLPGPLPFPSPSPFFPCPSPSYRQAWNQHSMKEERASFKKKSVQR